MSIKHSNSSIPRGLSLSRGWAAQSRSSAGLWWIDQLQGVIVEKDQQGDWRLLSPTAEPELIKMMERNHLRGKVFATRRDALQAAAMMCHLENLPLAA